MIDDDFLSFDLSEIVLPTKYNELWEEINLPIQTRKAQRNNVKNLDSFMDKLSKRSYYLCEIAKKYNVKNIAEVGTAEGWQFFSFAEYCRGVGGSVWSCDIDDRRHQKYISEYEQEAHFVLGDSEKLSNELVKNEQKIDLFYIDGCHKKDSVLRDVFNLAKNQTEESIPIWIFDDFDSRFGCYQDILKILNSSKCYYVYSPGQTASGNPTHQAIIKRRF